MGLFQVKSSLQDQIHDLRNHLACATLDERIAKHQRDSLQGQLDAVDGQIRTMENEREQAKEGLQVLRCNLLSCVAVCPRLAWSRKCSMCDLTCFADHSTLPLHEVVTFL